MLASISNKKIEIIQGRIIECNLLLFNNLCEAVTIANPCCPLGYAYIRYHFDIFVEANRNIGDEFKKTLVGTSLSEKQRLDINSFCSKTKMHLAERIGYFYHALSTNWPNIQPELSLPSMEEQYYFHEILVEPELPTL